VDASRPVSVAIIEDDAPLREGPGILIAGTPGYRLTGTFDSVEQAMIPLPTSPTLFCWTSTCPACRDRRRCARSASASPDADSDAHHLRRAGPCVRVDLQLMNSGPIAEDCGLVAESDNLCGRLTTSDARP
jgi:hypothetical protein